eukprot:6174851-Pleurochrysis_carterae.AAC.1
MNGKNTRCRHLISILQRVFWIITSLKEWVCSDDVSNACIGDAFAGLPSARCFLVLVCEWSWHSWASHGVYAWSWAGSGVLSRVRAVDSREIGCWLASVASALDGSQS